MTAFDPFAAQLFRCNGFHAAEGCETHAIVNPATLEEVGRTASATPELCDELAAEALAAQKEWKRVDAKTRAALLHRVADSIERIDFHDVAKLMTLEMGKPYPEAVGELYNVAPAFRYFAGDRPRRSWQNRRHHPIRFVSIFGL